ncbi:hypothetical protein EV144_102373 [Flavobacterium sp. 270]|nr:hypothetical protein [Flavobacterium sp. 270]TDW49943.1 hypothetical protein EV144_102373 [Flavobacterium sp. 270]
MLEKFLKNKDTKKLTKAEQIKISEGQPELNCNNAAADKYNAC